jgi:hypothetical protein
VFQWRVFVADYGSDEDFQSGDFDLSGFADQPHVDFRQFNANVSSYYNEDQGESRNAHLSDNRFSHC